MVITRNLAKNKQKTTRRAMDTVTDVRQNGCTRGIYNGNRAIFPVKINFPTDGKGSSPVQISRDIIFTCFQN